MRLTVYVVAAVIALGAGITLSRLWTAPEIRELLIEAGFRNPTVYWEGEDEDGEGNGEFTPEEKGEADLAWIAYVVAEN